MSTLMRLAAQQGAKAVMSASALSNYSDPVIDGVEVYPNNVRFSGSGSSSAAPLRITLNISKNKSASLRRFALNTTRPAVSRR